MKKHLTIPDRVAEPQSFITKGKHRLKQHNEIIYLNDGDEFEIELHNPTTNKVLAKISLNGNSIGSGIILKPGQRVFLERHLSEPKKFRYETYSVEDTEENEYAIQKNGDVLVEYFSEQHFYTNPITTYWVNYNSGNAPSFNINTLTGTNTVSNYTYTTATSGVVTNTSSTTIDTGRIEKGSNSNQTFDYDFSNYNSFSFHKDYWKILPKSVKPLTKEDLKTYCTECGAKRKKDTFKYCPHCGNKF